MAPFRRSGAYCCAATVRLEICQVSFGKGAIRLGIESNCTASWRCSAGEYVDQLIVDVEPSRVALGLHPERVCFSHALNNGRVVGRRCEDKGPSSSGVLGNLKLSASGIDEECIEGGVVGCPNSNPASWFSGLSVGSVLKVAQKLASPYWFPVYWADCP